MYFSENKRLALIDALSKIPELESLFCINIFIDIISNDEYNLFNELEKLGITKHKFNKAIKTLDIVKSGSSTKWCTHILRLNNSKYCKVCDEVYSLDKFPLNSTKSGGYGSCCKSCHYGNNKEKQVARTAAYKARLLQRVPKWANLNKISEFYSSCPIDKEVDHYYPLQGDTVSGLHVLENLQYLSKPDNISKNNKHPEQ